VNEPNWAEALTAVSAAIVPAAVLLVGLMLGKRQSRSEELTRVRLEYYKSLAPSLNRLMCYMLFIGTWRDDSPADIVHLKRSVDTTFHTAAPLFSPATTAVYKNMMDLTFTTYGTWGSDARIKTSAFRRRQARQGQSPWIESWNSFFTVSDDDAITGEWFAEYRKAYDSLLAQMVDDIQLAKRRDTYTTETVSLNAHDDRCPRVTGRQSRVTAKK
jgi:hypothetical protein